MQFVYYTEHIQLAAIPQHRSGSLSGWHECARSRCTTLSKRLRILRMLKPS